MAEIFLSYDSEDRETAGKVAALLASAGWTVWWDRRIPAGRTWRSALEEALTEMRCMVVLWSKHSIESHWVKEEAEEARSLEKLVPVLIDAVKPPVGFRAIQAADLVGWNGAENAPGARQLIADLESLLGKPDHKQADLTEVPHDAAVHAEKANPAVTPVQRVESHDAAVEAAATHFSRPHETSNGFSTWLNWKTGGIAAVVALLIAALSLWPTKKNSEETTVPSKVETVAAPPVVAPTVTGLTISALRKQLKTGETLELNVEASYSDGAKNRLEKVDRWEITPEKIVSIDDAGEIKALESGTAKIVARYGNLASEPWTVDVEAPPAVKVPRAVIADAPKRSVVESPSPKIPPVSEPSRGPVPVIKPRQSPTSSSNPKRVTVPREDLGGYLNRAKSYRVQGNYTAALAELERARAIDPANSEVRQEIAQTKKACEAEKSLGYNVNC